MHGLGAWRVSPVQKGQGAGVGRRWEALRGVARRCDGVFPYPFVAPLRGISKSWGMHSLIQDHHEPRTRSFISRAGVLVPRRTTSTVRLHLHCGHVHMSLSQVGRFPDKTSGRQGTARFPPGKFLAYLPSWAMARTAKSPRTLVETIRFGFSKNGEYSSEEEGASS